MHTVKRARLRERTRMAWELQPILFRRRRNALLPRLWAGDYMRNDLHKNEGIAASRTDIVSWLRNMYLSPTVFAHFSRTWFFSHPIEQLINERFDFEFTFSYHQEFFQFRRFPLKKNSNIMSCEWLLTWWINNTLHICDASFPILLLIVEFAHNPFHTRKPYGPASMMFYYISIECIQFRLTHFVYVKVLKSKQLIAVG